jgi:hypothetical protein
VTEELRLAEKVYGALSRETGAYEVGLRAADGGDCDRSPLERELVDWGVAAGLAYGIALAENPFEHEGARVERAVAAASLASRGMTTVGGLSAVLEEAS